ncbi:MAG: PQQ-binding-like beta-propeller repeat protein [Polyangiales bacterium]
MRTSLFRRRARTCALVATLMSGCASEAIVAPEAAPPAAQAAPAASGDCAPGESTYAVLQREIFDAPAYGCTLGFCHGTAPGQGLLDLRASTSYEGLVGVKSTLSTDKRVEPGAHAKSFLWQKIAAGTRDLAIEGGGPMPAGGFDPVPERALDALAQWIDAGAPKSGVVAGAHALLCRSTCASDTDCDNGNACDGVEVCTAGVCTAGKALACDDARACTRDRCDPKSGCAHEVVAGLACENSGTCDASGACVASGGVRLSQVWEGPVKVGVSSKPLVTANAVYVTAYDGNVYALDRKTGTELWRFATGAPVVHAGATLVPDGSILVGDGLAKVHRLDPSGKVIWTRDLQETGADHIWSNVTLMDGLVYVPLASHSDVPCTKGRTIAIELATGATAWTRWNVPRDGVCSSDTSIECKTAADCPNAGTCEVARGGAVTSPVTAGPDGKSVYVNTVGCYTFPQVGDTDAIMKLDAKTGETQWIRHFSKNEQFNFCSVSGKECRTVADCDAGQTCTKKPAYYDFGFINGPLVVDASDGAGGKRTLVVSGNKSGALHALRAEDGAPVWTNQVVPTPVSPRFAGFGTFNGAIAHHDGRFVAALYDMPGVVLPKHAMAFSEIDGAIAWSDAIGKSWGSVSASDGVAFMGTQSAPALYAYDVKTGQRLGTFPLPANTAGAPAIEGKDIFVGYGLGPAGGIRAYRIEP